MIVFLHVAIALSGIAAASYAYFRPSRGALHSSYMLVGATFASGFYLVVSSPAHMIQACMSGLVYLGVVSLAIMAARHKLAVKTKSNTEI